MLPAVLSHAILIVASWNLWHGHDIKLFDWSMLAMLLLVAATATSWDLVVRVAEVRLNGAKPARGVSV
jgi:hypothetical protein